MQTSTIIVLACFVAVTYAKALQPEARGLEVAEDLESIHEAVYDAPEQQRSERNKRGLLLLKKKLLLGVLGLKAAKVTAVGGAVAGAALAKSKQHHTKTIEIVPYKSHTYSSHGPSWNVDVTSWH